MKNASCMKITCKDAEKFKRWLRSEERSEGTIAKYARDLSRFSDWLDGRNITKERLTEYKAKLAQSNLEPTTVNSMLAAINTYCRFIGFNVRLKFLRVQKKLFREENREMNRADFAKLVHAAETKGSHRLALLMETIGATGIRVSEVRYITVEAVQNGSAQISLKGKMRCILLPGKLCRKLLRYAQKQKIRSGEIFITKSGRGISRKQIWAEMKAICKCAGVAASKVFPHNLRHLFARVFYRTTQDVARLADLLGHSSIETTRIYLISTGAEHARQLDRLGLVQ